MRTSTNRSRLSMMPLMLGLLSVMVSGVLVAWRRIDANFSLPPDHHPYETQSYGGTRVQHKTSDMQYYMQAHEKGSTSGGPYKTLVLYVYHESDEVTKDNLLFFLKVRSMVGWWCRRGETDHRGLSCCVVSTYHVYLILLSE